MKKIYLIKSRMKSFKTTAICCLMAAGAALTAYGAMTSSFYKANSILSQDKWVKIGVEKTGVYEITYDLLREMGFNDPSKVSVYGRGGRQLSESFVTNAGVPIITDDLTPAKVIHEGNKLFFYGLGPDEIGFETSSAYATGGYFNRKSNNIYSRRGYYFLTDSKPVSNMAERDYSADGAEKITKGVSYVYHELDSAHNYTRSGQLFWGERLGRPGDPRRRWDVTLPDAIKGDGVMQCVMYFEPQGEWNFGWSETGNPDGHAQVSFGFEGTKGYFTTPYKENQTLYLAPHEPTLATVEIPGTSGKVFAELADTPEMSSFSNVDFWVVSYQSGIPTLTGPQGESLSQRLIAFPSVSKGSAATFEIQNPASLIAIEVTAENDPQRLKISQRGAIGSVCVQNTGKTPVVVVFDKNRPQLQISGYRDAYTQISNQNLHALKADGADLIIVCTPKFRPYAEQIAQLHRDYDGIEVAVATTEECYNEFSGGTPDPMGIRSFAKMLYFSDRRKPKNILLMGPLNADFRGMSSEHDPLEGIIAYQSPAISLSRGAHNINDFYGMMGDKFRTDYYERNNVNLGVGILPVKFESDAQILVEKIENYLKRTDHAYFLNMMTAVGGLGDEHTHDTQVRDLGDLIRKHDNQSTLFTPLAIDTYGNAEARKKFINQLTEGCNMFSYFGHGAEQFLGKDRNFFNAGDVFALRNRTLPFALFGGCQITNTDRGFRGLGETIVTSTPYGCIGSIVSGRDTWSGQNYEFFKQFILCTYYSGSNEGSPRLAKPQTIGELYARVKDISTYNNELAYQLLCDPAIILPSINRSIGLKTAGKSLDGNSTITPGNKVTLSGNITDFDGKADSSFSGEVVIRLCEPARQIGAGMIETKEDPKALAFTYRDSQAGMTAGEVKDGKFTVDLHVPASMATFSGQKAIVYVSAYDPSTKVGAGKSFEITLKSSAAATEEAADKTAPRIESLTFRNRDCAIEFTVSDNLALNLATSPLSKGVYLYIDGKERSEAHFTEAMIENGGKAMSKNVLLEGLSYGVHSARLKVKDAAGNAAEREIVFTYRPEKGQYSIIRDEKSSTPQATVIAIDGQMPQSATLVVISPEGNEVWRGDFKDGRIEWNHTMSNGSKAPVGHYKAYLLETGDGMRKGYSDTIDVPVI